MHQPMEFLLRHGYSLLFAMVLAEQLGAPIPAMPVLLALGALIGTGKYSFAGALSLSLAAALAADGAWYLVGRTRGSSVLKLLCRISLEPDSCVSSTRSWFKRLGGWALVIAKFVPGLGTLSAAMAGLSRMPWWKFLGADGLGGLLWAGAYLSLGYVFRAQLDDVAVYASRMGGWLIVVLGGGLALWIGWKYYQRRRFFKKLRMARIRPQELMPRLGEMVVIDLRTAEEAAADGARIPGSVWLDRTILEERYQEIPRDRDVVLYCNCPSEASSARAALVLRRYGITRVRPLEGGFEAWRELNYPVELVGLVEMK
jgi:membrane protein DedA with SNARE-associated domain/rhodanese-related sulfurtransferase